MADVIWSCPICGTDLRDWWCSWCECLWSPQAIADWDDPPDYQHPEDQDDEPALWTADTGDDAWWTQ